MADFGEPLAVTALSLARRFADDATLWCVAPEWPEHARHVAVEFVHPVLVGKRAFPAVSIESSDPATALRSLVRAGDVVLAISPGNSAPTTTVMRRAQAWGVTTLWLGAGPRPAMRAADHIVWIDDGADEVADEIATPAAYDGRLVLLYHVLWELTHVCFEHPGLLEVRSDPSCDDDVCITCSDEGRIGEVLTADSGGRARVRTAVGIETIDTTIVPTVVPGDLVLIHAGAAISEVP
ncbi:MAG: hydrogenase assembly protein HupF [Ilumatobacteraceae bacterium]